MLEDVPFGLVCTALLGRLAGRPAPLHEAGIALMSAAYGRDLEALNDLIPAVGLRAMTLDELLRVASRGLRRVAAFLHARASMAVMRRVGDMDL